jgi:hypothetical protein
VRGCFFCVSFNFLKVFIMSIKSNLLKPIALAALGVAVTHGAIAESLLDNYTVKAVKIAQVDDALRCLVVVTVNDGVEGSVDQVRFVATVNGDLKVFANLGATTALVQKSNMSADAVTTVVRRLVPVTVPNPVNSLKALYKAAKKSKLSTAAELIAITAQKTAAQAQNWPNMAGTQFQLTYQDYLLNEAVVTEANAFEAARVVSLAASLTAAGVDPLTVI